MNRYFGSAIAVYWSILVRGLVEKVMDFRSELGGTSRVRTGSRRPSPSQTQYARDATSIEFFTASQSIHALAHTSFLQLMLKLCAHATVVMRMFKWHEEPAGSTDPGMLHAVFIRFREHATGADLKEVSVDDATTEHHVRVVTEEQTRHIILRWDHVISIQPATHVSSSMLPTGSGDNMDAWRRAGTARWLSTCM